MIVKFDLPNVKQTLQNVKYIYDYIVGTIRNDKRNQDIMALLTTLGAQAL